MKTYTCELETTVTAFRRSALLLDVQVSELATGRPDGASLVGDCVVSVVTVSVLPLRPSSIRLLVVLHGSVDFHVELTAACGAVETLASIQSVIYRENIDHVRM